MDAKLWLVGLAFSVVVGGIVTWAFLRVLRWWMRLPPKRRIEGKKAFRGVPPFVTGAVERLFFSVLVALNVEGFAAAMVGWLALKLATNWNRDFWKKTSSARLYGFSALMAGLVSMLFAFLGGLIAKGEMWTGLATYI